MAIYFHCQEFLWWGIVDTFTLILSVSNSVIYICVFYRTYNRYHGKTTVPEDIPDKKKNGVESGKKRSDAQDLMNIKSATN